MSRPHRSIIGQRSAAATRTAGRGVLPAPRNGRLDSAACPGVPARLRTVHPGHDRGPDLSLGLSLERRGRLSEAADAFARAAAARPYDAEAHLRLGEVLRKLGRPAAAAAAARRAVELRPRDALACRALAGACMDRGRYHEAAEWFRRAEDMGGPTAFASGSDYLHLLHYDPAISRERLLAEAKRWAGVYAEALMMGVGSGEWGSGEWKGMAAQPTAPYSQLLTPHSLRIGYLSGDWRNHPVARLMVPVLAHLDRGRFDVFCYDDGGRPPDATTDRLRSFPATWRPIRGLSDGHVAEQVRADGIDVLVDLGGHMGSRLLVFARKPAAVQVTHFNYPDTTGMRAMDWRISDAISEPPGEPDGHDRYSVERLFRLDGCAWCYDPGEPAEVPDVGPLPALAVGRVTFASLNKPVKHTPQAARLWSDILKAVPGSQLVLLGFADYQENAILAEPFAPHGVLDRLIFAARLPRRRYLDLYNRIDIALDPFPYNGGVTTCDALLMGVPVVTLEGDSYLSRQGLMLLNNVGLPQGVARTPEQYVRIAVEMAADLPRLAAIRSDLRRRIQSSPVMDGPAFARKLSNAYVEMWRTRRAGFATSAPGGRNAHNE